MKVETRHRTTRGDVEEYYAAAKHGYWDFDNFMLAGNPRFNEVDWNTFDDAGYRRLTRAQQILNGIALFQQELFRNGVAGVFGFGEDVTHIRSAIGQFGWDELASRFDAIFVDALGSNAPSWPAASERLAVWFNNLDGGFYRGMAFDKWFGEALEQGALASAVVAFCQAHEDELFELVG